MGLEEVMKFVAEKLQEALVAMENLGGSALAWFDNIFPPETRGDTVKNWFHVALPWIIGVVVLVLVICFLRCCCRCCCGGGGRTRTMKAPGRNCRMSRDVFEGDPRGYFRNLRSHPGDQLC